MSNKQGMMNFGMIVIFLILAIQVDASHYSYIGTSYSTCVDKCVLDHSPQPLETIYACDGLCQSIVAGNEKDRIEYEEMMRQQSAKLREETDAEIARIKQEGAAEIARIEAESDRQREEHEAWMAETQEDIDKTKARSAIIAERTEAIKAMIEKIKNNEVEPEDIPCDSLSDPSVREMITELKEEYAGTGDDYISYSALSSDKKLYGVKMVDGELQCHGYKKIDQEERQRKQEEIEERNKKETEAFEKLWKQAETGEMIAEEVQCDDMQDPRLVYVNQWVKDSYARTGEDTSGGGMSADDGLYSIQITGGELSCHKWVKNVIQETSEASIAIGVAGAVRGKVEVKQADGSWKQMIEGEALKAGDLIRTRSDGSAMLNFDESDVTLGPNTAFRVEELDSTKKTFTLSTGKIWAYVQKLAGQRFTVKTPKGHAFIRGTEFLIKYDEETETATVHLYEGEIEIRTDAGADVISAGKSVTFDETGITSDQELTEESWQSSVWALEITAMPRGDLNWMKAVFIGGISGGIAVLLLVLFKKLKRSKKK